MEVECWISSHSNHSVRLRVGSINEQFKCQICSRSVSGAPFYSCDSCTRFCVHKSCTELPYKILHPFHSHSPMFLYEMSTWCDTCFNDVNDAWFYSCGSSPKFNIDSECALMPLVTPGREGQDWIRHFGHQHPLLLLRVDDDQHLKCLVCRETHLPLDLYGCSKCGYFLHKSCAELPAEIHLPLHRNHRAALSRAVTGRSFVCGMCGFHSEGRFKFAYNCEQCSLDVCFKCAEVAWKSIGSNKYEDHDHLLCLLQNVLKDDTTITRCDAYDSYCSQHVVTSSDEFKKMEPFMLWCYQCGFRVHLLCAPLPSMVKHEFHIHPLLLVDSMREDDSGEYNCNVCKTKRDSMIRLYCCQDCKYFAHVHCLRPEIMKILCEDLRDVELKIVGQDTWNVLKIEHVDSSLTLKDVINKLPGWDKDSLLRFYNLDDNGKEEDGESSNSYNVGDEEIDEILQLSHLNGESFRSFWSNLRDNSCGKRELKASDLALKIKKVNNYLIPHSLAAVLNKLLHEFGDIGSGLASTKYRSFVFFIVCKVVKGMYSTMPKCITKDLLQEWYYHLCFARSQAFKVDFACAKLEQLIHAFLGFQAKRLEQEIPAILSQKIDELNRKSNELQRKLDKCKEYRGSSSKPEYTEFCLNKASEIEFSQNPNVSGDSLSQNWSPEDIQSIVGVNMW